MAEDQGQEMPESPSYQDWKNEATELEEWFETTKGKCLLQGSISRDSSALKEREQAAKVRQHL